MVLEKKSCGHAGIGCQAAGWASGLEHGTIDPVQTSKSQDFLRASYKLPRDILFQVVDDGGPAGKDIVAIAAHQVSSGPRCR